MLDRREVRLATAVLEEGRLLVIAPNKLDAVLPSQRQAVLRALELQVGLHALTAPD